LSRPGVSIAIAGALAVLCSGCGGGPEPAAAPVIAGNGHNVVLLTIDTLRADHLGSYGYGRPTSPAIDALAARGALFERSFTHWPKTRGSFVCMLTGRYPSVNGYSKEHPTLLDHNPTLASVLRDAGYLTVAAVDNPNVAASLGYSKGFERYRETWEEADLTTEMDRTRAITQAAREVFAGSNPQRPFLLWLHYVNPHTPYTPPPPYDSAFVDADTRAGESLPLVDGLHGGIPKQWAHEGEDRLAYYIAQYDGEIAAVDHEVGEVLSALTAAGLDEDTVVVLTSDHGESLGEHGYFFDHGENLFDPSLRVPLIVRVPGGSPGVRSGSLTSTLDVVPTILDAVKVSYPADLGGRSLLGDVQGGSLRSRARLFAQNDRNLSAAWGTRYKVIATPTDDGVAHALYDREKDPAEVRDVAQARPYDFQVERQALGDYLDARGREWISTQRRLQGHDAVAQVSAEACEKLKALGYAVDGCG
jgi:arylsulfatase A-like enzyme